MKVAVTGIGMHVPKNVVTNQDLEQKLDTTDEWIYQRTGIKSRHIVGPDESTTTMATQACLNALENADTQPSDIDLIIVATVTPDEVVPGAAPVVQSALKATSAGALDINAGCTGFVSAIALGASAIEAGTVNQVLVCGAETLSSITDQSDRGTAVVFGDGAGAVVLHRDPNGDFGPFVFGSDGTMTSRLCTPKETGKIAMHGKDVYKHAVDRMTATALKLVDGIGIDQVDLVVAHQANSRIVRAVANRLKLHDDQVVDNIERYGNTSAASIPIALAEAVDENRLKKGMRVLVVAFGAGYVWAGGLIQW